MNTVKVHLMDRKYAVKPEGKYGFISKRITKRITEIDIDTLAEKTSSGRAFTPAIFYGDRIIENFAQEQVFALDFDSGITVEEFLCRADQCQVIPAFVYATYSHSEKKPRFRAVFVHNCLIKDRRDASIIIGMLHQIFPEADKNCTDVSRIYLGGKGLLSKNVDLQVVGMGAIGYCPVSIPDIFKAALLSNAADIMLFHNHPTGDTSPSTEDALITERVEVLY